MITRPLDLAAKLSPAPRDFDVMFWMNIAGIALFFGLLGSRFILSTGVPVQIDQAQGAALELPQVRQADQAAASIVVSYRRDNMILFEGGIYELRELRLMLEGYTKKHPDAVMLVRIDRQVSAQGVFDLYGLAQELGFQNIVFAAEPKSGTLSSGFVQPNR